MKTFGTSLFKEGAKARLIGCGMKGVYDFADLIVDDIYGSLKFTEDYDSLPLLVRMWLRHKDWEELKSIATFLYCNDIIYYTDFLCERDDGSLSAMPLIITDGEIAVLLSPRWISPEEFQIHKVTEKR